MLSGLAARRSKISWLSLNSMCDQAIPSIDVEKLDYDRPNVSPSQPSKFSPFQLTFVVFRLLKFEDVMDKELLQVLVAEVDAKLFK